MSLLGIAEVWSPNHRLISTTFRIQDELNSWSPPSSSGGQIAGRPVHAEIKEEIADVTEYYIGCRPQYVECQELTPLIGGLIEQLPVTCTSENFYLHMQITAQSLDTAKMQPECKLRLSLDISGH